MKTMKILYTLLCTMLLGTLTATAQNTTDDKNKAIIETNDGSQELNTDDISVIRFNGGKVTVVQPSGETTFDRTLRSLSFQRPNPGTLRLTATTSIGTEGSGNRAQAIEDGKLKATWAEGDKVYVYADASTTTSIGTLTPKSDDWGSSTATLTGDIDATNLSEGETTLYFSTQPRPFDFSSQDGTVESLFYFTATGTVTIDNANASVPDLSFTRPIAVVKFTLKDKADGTSPVYAKSLTVNDGTNTYTVTPASATNVLYVGIPAISSQTVTLTATDGLSSYTYERASVTFANNKYYAINVKMTNTTDYLTVPLTFEATADGTITFYNEASGAVTYTINGGSSQTIASNDYEHIGVNAGDKVCFYGDNAAYATSTSNYSFFNCSANCYIYGNVMSLVSSTDYANAKTLTEAYAFYYLFNNNSHLVNHPSKTLELPATTLTDNCYYGMFMQCTNLTKAPELPATTLADNCYYLMFRDCKSLTTAPSSLPATTMVSYCCNRMFQGCTSLTTAPELPATTLADHCYYLMFLGCTNLTTPPSSLPATTLANRCCERMFQDCTSLTTAPALPAETLASHCYIRMFQGCTSLTTAPELPATTLADNCYYEMFRGCTNLTTAPDLPATTLADNCYSYMFKGCTNLTTAPALPATTLALSCYNSMFADCTSLTTAPTLPAETLADNCYSYMFNGCSSLNSITCLATSIVPGQATDYWLEDVAATGTFNKASSMESWTTGANGIPSGWTVINDGVLPGQFTVNAGGGKVSFSMGSLQYQANSTGATSAPYTGVWRFAGHQYDNIGADNKNISESYTGWIDLFGWGTSGYVHRTSDYQPWSHTQTNETFIAYNSLTKNLYDEDGKADWGYNAISNGGNTENSGWRTPKNDEWGYLFNTRTTTFGIRYAKATVNGVTGVILLPDDWDASYYALNNTNVAYATWSSNVISLSDWGSKLEAHGAVFLPTSGNRDSNHAPTSGFVNIWSSDNDDNNNAHCVFIPEDRCSPTDHAYRSTGLIVRLVKNNIGAGSISYATSEVNKLSVDAAFTNELTLEGDGTVTYAVSSGDNICTVNASTGLVTLNGTAGTCTITATVTNSPFYTYATSTASYTLTVTAATLSVTASDYSGTYDGTAHGITVTCDGATIKYRTTDSGEYDLTENPTYSAVGTYTVYYQVTRDYYTTVTGSQTVSISKAMLTATADDASRDYGSNNPTFTVNVTGFVNGETTATAAGYTAPTASTTANSSSNAGDYAITPSGGSATNYDFTYVDGTLTINKVAATLTCSNELISFGPTDNVNAQKTKTGVGCNGGTITVSGGSSSTFTASYNNYSHTIYITRWTTDEIPVTTVTVSVTPDKNHTAPNSVTFSVKAALFDSGVALANSAVIAGYKVGSNGKAYAPNATLPNGITVIGMVARRNSGTSGSGIVLYKQDNSGLYTWANRNEGNPSGVQVYVNDLSSKTNKSWTCGTKTQYESCGVDSSGWSTLQSRLSSAGCTQFSSGSEYWSADESSNSKAYYFKDGTWKTNSKNSVYKVRPLFTF